MPLKPTAVWVWPLALMLAIVVQYVTVITLHKREVIKSEERRVDDVSSRLRLDNELRATIWATQSGMSIPMADGELQAIPVKPWNLVEACIGHGRYAYVGRLVAMPLVNYEAGDGEVYWHVGGQRFPPAIVLRFDGQLPHGRRWIIGRVTSVEADGLLREHPEVKFKVIVSDCKVMGD